jgi:hypothetical protein
MGNFSTDADLLGYEPNVFAELPFASQRKLKVTDAALSGVNITSATGGFSMLAAKQVAVLEASAAESQSHAIASITGNTALMLATRPVGLSVSTGITLSVRTLCPQATLVHEELLRAMGIDPDDPDAEVNESAIVSVELMRRLEALGTLSRAYTAAVALVGDNSGVHAKATEYTARFRRALAGAQVLIDLDGDGRPDAWRTPGTAQLLRV